MSRRLAVRRFIAVCLIAALGVSGARLSAEDNQPPRAGQRPAARLDRGQLVKPDLRMDSLRAQASEPLDPQMEQILVEWSARTKQIKKLQGCHHRAVIEYTFGTEKRSEGKFYYESPDRGRIDLLPYSKAAQTKTSERQTPDGKKLVCTVLSDKRERWICDGEKIKQIDDEEKTYDVLTIPAMHRGENIMDGPLPFLFGMPPDKAKQRYAFKLAATNEKAYTIHILPKLKQDAASWKRAELVLGRIDFLPQRVHLYDPTGNSETVYYFHDIEVNKINILIWKDPFRPSLLGYRAAVHNPPEKEQRFAKGKSPEVPSVVGMPWQPAVEILEKKGLRVVRRRGAPATAAAQVHHVEHQELNAGGEVVLTIYDKMLEKTAEDTQQRSLRDPQLDQRRNGRSTDLRPQSAAKLPAE